MTVLGTSWRTTVVMSGLVTFGETDTQDTIVTWRPVNQNSGIGGLCARYFTAQVQDI